jgi:hypothetical protein
VVPVERRDGSLTLYVGVPGAGELSARALATVPTTARAGAKHAVRRASARTSTRRGRARGKARLSLRPRTIASASMRSTVPGLVSLPLRVQARYARLLVTHLGIYAIVRVAFAARGRPPLAATVAVLLRRTSGHRPASGGGKHPRGGAARRARPTHDRGGA